MSKSLNELRQMQRTQLTRITKEEIIDSILSSPTPDHGALLELTDKLTTLVNEVAELRRAVTAPDSNINRRFVELQDKVDKQGEIIAKQQRYLESLDRKERETNLIITGVPDENESLEGGTSEEDKLSKIWVKVGVEEEMQSHRRLGTRGTNNTRRPILVTLANRQTRDRILEKASQLKQAGGEFMRIYIKKDVHPSIRREWKRLRDAEKAEKERPENSGCVIHLDTRERKLYRDGTLIDAWNLQFF